MSRAVVILGLQSERKRAADWCMKAPAGTIVEFKESKRTTEQNSRMWAMLTEVARQVTATGETTLSLRRQLAAKVYARTAAYDAAIAAQLPRFFAAA